MFRPLFFILICTVFIYGFWGIYSPIKDIPKEQISYSFENYLSGALSRNTLPSKKYDIVFFREDFVDEYNPTKLKSKEKYNSYAGKEIPIVYNKSNSQRGKEWGYPQGFFGTPSIESQGVGYQSNCKGGLIFDPCLVIGDSIPASGGMYFGSDKS